MHNEKEEQDLTNHNESEGSAENTENTDNMTAETTAESETTTDWEKKYQETYDNYLRLFSEFDNFRKRTIKERSDLLKSASSDVLKSLLPVLDDMERALNAAENNQDIAALRTGVELIYQKFRNTLQEKGLSEMQATGVAFDPELHEAITHIPAPSDDLKGKIIDVVEKGYTLNDKIIRYPKVVVGN